MSGLRQAIATRPNTGAAQSREARRLLSDLLAVEPGMRRLFLHGLDATDMRWLFATAERDLGSAYGLWADDCEGFIEDVLGESLWSKSREIMRAIPAHPRVAVPSCFASSKTWAVARAILWHGSVHPVGTSKAVTIAPLWRQVIRQIWPEIRSAHRRAGLPGQVDTFQWKRPSREGLDTVVAYGVAANPNNESSTQGIHAPHLLLVVDEGGGIARVIGRNLRALLTGDDARMVVIGNPPTDDEGTWFEDLCSSDNVRVIPISAYDTPNFTGERAPRCRSCPPEVPEHSLAAHLVDRAWVAETLDEYGEDSPYVQSKVYARFPRGGAAKAIPSRWVDLAADAEEPEPDAEHVALADLGLDEEDRPWLVRRGAWIRLGVDVAADGGDELVVARLVGDLGTIEHTSSGADNAHPVDVAGVVLRHVKRAEALRAAIGSAPRVRVKVDGIGVGWGVAGVLQAWGSEGLHDAEIVPVIVSEEPGREPPPGSTMRPYRKRDEMWLASRGLLTPLSGGEGRLRYRVDRRTLAQLSAPTYGTTASGYTVIESKKSLRKRGLKSPDRAEALLLAPYEPQVKAKRGKARLLV